MADEVERAIDEALEGRPRAEQVAEIAAALRERRKGLARELQTLTDPEERKAYEKRIDQLDEQIAMLRQEQAIAEFVENSVRATAARPDTVHDFDIPDGPDDPDDLP